MRTIEEIIDATDFSGLADEETRCAKTGMREGWAYALKEAAFLREEMVDMLIVEACRLGAEPPNHGYDREEYLKRTLENHYTDHVWSRRVRLVLAARDACKTGRGA